MAVDMRHTKLSAEDAALIAGEVVKPSWASRNEGIHERVSFDDTLWGFELAGGSFYKTPLRVVYVKPGSRAEQASIRKGDTVLRINDIDTSTLTLQEAHDIVLESGIHLRIAVTAPEDEVDAYYTYEDPIAEANRIAEELRKAMEAERIRRAIERAHRSCSLPWPWVRRKIIIYRESNCFLVPSIYEGKHKEKYPELPHVRYTDDICEFNRGTPVVPVKKDNGQIQETEKGEPVTDNEENFDKLTGDIDENEQNKIIDQILEENEDEVESQKVLSDVDENAPSDIDEAPNNTKEDVIETEVQSNEDTTASSDNDTAFNNAKEDVMERDNGEADTSIENNEVQSNEDTTAPSDNDIAFNNTKEDVTDNGEADTPIENNEVQSNENTTAPSDVDTALNNTNDDVMETDNEEADTLIENNEVQSNEDITTEAREVEDRLAPEVVSTNEIPENSSQDKEEIEAETNNVFENDISVDEEEEEIERRSYSAAPVSDYIEEDVGKSEADNVVDCFGWMDDGDINDPTNER